MVKPRFSEVVAGMKLHRPGFCNICGRPTIFFAINPTPESVRNTMHCFFCGSTSRNRHVAKVILDEIAGGENCVSNSHKLTTLRIYNCQRGDAISRQLGDGANFVCSDFIPDIIPGTEIAPRQFCQDLERLSFENDSFDVVITEDVLEHVRDEKRAFREIYRVLQPGGYHVFTVPFLFDRNTLVRIDTSTEEDIHLLPPEYHGDPVRGGIITYRTFGLDMFDLLNVIGFETSVVFANYADRRFGIMDSFVFCSRKSG